MDIALRGHQMTVTNAHLLANDLSTGGLYPKALQKDRSFKQKICNRNCEDGFSSKLLFTETIVAYRFVLCLKMSIRTP